MKNLNLYRSLGTLLVLFLFAASITFAQESKAKKTDAVKNTSYTKTVDTAKKDCSKDYTSSTCTHAKTKDAKMTGKKNCTGDCKAKHGAMMKTPSLPILVRQKS